ncbi:hypothetical protein CO610_02090 [Lysobacteraceae bacterium NML95-0200]|nr:hypothetical protein CO610_02090 [Xanthomonadaceae bacterium NML95-0200]
MKKQILVLSISLVLAPLAMAEGAQRAGRPLQAQTDAQRQADESRHCLRHTGSRIHSRRMQRQHGSGRKAGSKDCAMLAGRAYSREDIERTGAFDLHDVLRRLDPAIH